MSELYLDDIELNAIAHVDALERLAKLEERVAEKDLVIETLKQQNLEWQYKLAKQRIADATASFKEAKGRAESQAESRRAIFKEIAKKYGIDGRWGYNPDDGQIYLGEGEDNDST